MQRVRRATLNRAYQIYREGLDKEWSEAKIIANMCWEIGCSKDRALDYLDKISQMTE